MTLKHILSVLNLFIALTCAAQTGKVIKVKDGDTIVILDENNAQHIVRVADIDCPENGQPFSNVAKQFVSDAIFGQMVNVKVKGLDRYGRTIGFVLYSDRNLSLELLRAGLAWHYSYYSDDTEMAGLELEARANKVGLWADSYPINPYEWRKGKRSDKVFD